MVRRRHRGSLNREGVSADGADVGHYRTRSRRGRFFALVLLLVSAGSGYECWRSYANFSSLRWGGFVAMTAEGKICLLHSSTLPAGPVRNGVHTVPIDHADKNAMIIKWPMFDYGWTTDPVRGETRLSVVTPLWVLALLFAAPAVWWLARGRHEASLADEMD
jgi:hypothetical protein